MPEPCKCPTPYCEYEEGTVDVIAGGTSIPEAAENAKRKAEKEARREAKARFEALIGTDDACEPPCRAWYRVLIGEPQAQEYPFHSDLRQFAFGWCKWTLLVKCEPRE